MVGHSDHRPAITGPPREASASAHHGHGHTHSHAGATRSRLAAVLAITATVFVLEVVGAVVSGSLTLLADAGHVLTDVAGLGAAYAAAVLAERPADDRRTWGFRRAEVLAAAGQAAVLLAVGGYVLVESVRRLWHPGEVAASAMVVFGALGLVGNLLALGVLARSRQENLNTRAAFLEVLADAAGSAAVLVAAAIVAVTGWHRADAVASLGIGALILPRTWRLLRESVDVLLEATPRSLDLATVREHLLAVPGVLDVHDLHATSVASDLPVLTGHVVVEDGAFTDGRLPALLDRLQGCLAGHFDVDHSTLQFEAAGHAAHESHAAHP